MEQTKILNLINKFKNEKYLNNVKWSLANSNKSIQNQSFSVFVWETFDLYMYIYIYIYIFIYIYIYFIDVTRKIKRERYI